MKKILLIISMIFLSSLFYVSVSAEAQYYYVNVKEGVKLREMPTTESKELTRVLRGGRVLVKSTENDWYKVSYKNYDGWIKGEFLSPYTFDESNRYDFYLEVLSDPYSHYPFGLLQDFNKDGKEDLFLVEHVSSEEHSINFKYKLFDGEKIVYENEHTGGLYLLDVYDYKAIGIFESPRFPVGIDFQDQSFTSIDVITPIYETFTKDEYSHEWSVDNNDVEINNFYRNSVLITEGDFESKSYTNSNEIIYDFIYPHGELNMMNSFNSDLLINEIISLKIANDSLNPLSTEEPFHEQHPNLQDFILKTFNFYKDTYATIQEQIFYHTFMLSIEGLVEDNTFPHTFDDSGYSLYEKGPIEAFYYKYFGQKLDIAKFTLESDISEVNGRYRCYCDGVGSPPGPIYARILGQESLQDDFYALKFAEYTLPTSNFELLNEAALTSFLEKEGYIIVKKSIIDDVIHFSYIDNTSSINNLDFVTYNKYANQLDIVQEAVLAQKKVEQNELSVASANTNETQVISASTYTSKNNLFIYFFAGIITLIVIVIMIYFKKTRVR